MMKDKLPYIFVHRVGSYVTFLSIPLLQFS